MATSLRRAGSGARLTRHDRSAPVPAATLIDEISVAA
jgi:hypothetical protein